MLTARALLPELRERYPKLRAVPLDDDDDRAADRPQQPSVRRRSVLLSLRPGLHRQPDAQPGEAAALHHDGDRALAEPAARLPPRAASGRCWSTAGSRRARIRATGSRARSSAASCATSIASACRATSRRGASSTSAPSRERVVVTGSLKFDSLEIPGASASGDRGRNRVLRYFRIAAGPAGHHRRQHAARRRGAGPRRVPAHSRDDDQRAAHHRAAQARTLRRGRAAGAPGRLERRAADRAARRCRAALRRRHSRHHRRARAGLPGRDRRCSSAAASSTLEATISSNRRCSGSQSSLVRTCTTSPRSRGRSSRTGRRSRCARRASSSRRCSICSAIRFAAPRSVPAARALVEANRGARNKTPGRDRAAAAARQSRRRGPSLSPALRVAGRRA